MNAAKPGVAEATGAGARPEGARGEREAASHVRRMFGEIAPRYDFLNHFLSFQFDRLWRKRAASRFREILARSDARVLDLCCGTGDMALTLAAKSGAAVFGADFSHPMLVRALEKAQAPATEPSRGTLHGFVEADALRLPFADATFDLITVAFGFRNLANYDQGLREMFRLLRSGGQIGILDFSEPSGALFKRLYRVYFHRILPRLGGSISGNRTAYTYLPGSVERFPLSEELKQRILTAGFCSAEYETWTGGVVALHRAKKP